MRQTAVYLVLIGTWCLSLAHRTHAEGPETCWSSARCLVEYRWAYYSVPEKVADQLQVLFKLPTRVTALVDLRSAIGGSSKEKNRKLNHDLGLDFRDEELACFIVKNHPERPFKVEWTKTFYKYNGPTVFGAKTRLAQIDRVWDEVQSAHPDAASQECQLAIERIQTQLPACPSQ